MALYKTGIANSNQGVTISTTSATSDFNNQILNLHLNPHYLNVLLI
jgi:hypothetical protein